MVVLKKAMPSYDDIIAMLMSQESKIANIKRGNHVVINEIEIQRIWHKYFGGIRPFPAGGDFLAEWVDIADYTNEYQFPLCVDTLNMYWEADIMGQMIHDFIPYLGYGINNEEPLYDVEPHKRPIVYLLVHLQPDLFELTCDSERAYIEGYWQDQRRHPREFSWGSYIDTQLTLDRLSYPYNGLWLINATTHKCTGNVFLDTYGGWDTECLPHAMWWSIENIDFLTMQWNQIHHKVTEYDQYKAWFEMIPNAEELVIEELFKLGGA